VNRVVAKDDLESEAEAFAEKIAGKLGSAVRIGKRAFYEQIELPLDQAYQLTGAVMVENMLNRDTAEGISAFLDKRQPDWSQKE
jgi:enoyl-CoA hydratase/carnithine racemase